MSTKTIRKNMKISNSNSIPFQTAYGPKLADPVIGPFEPSKTDQEQALSSDINVIVRRILKDPEHLIQMQRAAKARFGDETLLPKTLQDAREIVRSANDSFNALPAELRAEFQNDVVNLLKAVEDAKSDPDALKRLQKSGIVSSRVPHDPQPGEAKAQPQKAPEEPGKK